MSETGEPVTKRLKKSTDQLPDGKSGQLKDFFDLYKGPEVTIIVQEKKFNLPKRLLCHFSPVFNAAFNGEFKEGVEQEMTLETTLAVFEHVTKWIFTGNLIIEPPKNMKAMELIITELVAFLKLADYLCLSGSSKPAAEVAKKWLPIYAQNLGTQSIREVMELPKDDLLQTLVLKACVKPYLQRVWKHRDEVLRIQGFVPAFFKHLDKTLSTMSRYGVFKDPLTGDSFGLRGEQCGDVSLFGRA